MSIWRRWKQGQHVEVLTGVFKDHIGVLQDASGEGEGRIDSACVLQVAFLIDNQVSLIWLSEDDCILVTDGEPIGDSLKALVGFARKP